MDMIHDHVNKRYSFVPNPLNRLSLIGREWKDYSKTLLVSDMVWFTDGSKIKDGTGAGIHGMRPVEDFFIPMRKHPTVFQ